MIMTKFDISDTGPEGPESKGLRVEIKSKTAQTKNF
jgi:hypothetical protein